MATKPETLGQKLALRAGKTKTQSLAMRLLWRVVRILCWPVGRRSTPQTTPHSLIANDRHGFMKNLRLDAKTVVIDGSNIFHFGHDHGLDAQPLGLLAHQLRNEGYRVVCFFDANIFYTLSDAGAFGSQTRHHVSVLTDLFGLQAEEIYIVPSGIQADQYILNTLRHLPISFAVTNDRFRDYSKLYSDVMKGQWRKGVTIQKNELRLLQHKFHTPIKLAR